ncbi:SIR2 family protein [Nocardioides sp.]|uniref:SIR2 family protein n=1 Tax=Nocardioides sp. TaxID=35761 RepID=UPI0026237D4B|nr:SIR2 family protein [Nocardioides sp.]MDI6910397.1 SIR2 family protein [Nocardioides sp.]
MSGGHVFVVNGRIEDLVHDAAVIPTDEYFVVEPHWDELLGRDPGRLQPSEWSPGGYGRAADGMPVWFIDVGDSHLHDVGPLGLAARLATVMREIAESGLEPMKGRLLPLVAVPVLGIGLGGLAGRQGEVVVALLETLEHAVQEHEIDVVVVTPDRSVYAAVQHKRKSLRSSEPSDRGQRRLGDLAARGQLALMIGAGASIPAGLPSWEELIDQLGANQDRSVLSQVRKLAESPLDQAELLSRLLSGQLGPAVVAAMHRTVRPSLAHALLAGLRTRETLTTNYDSLFERAVRAADPNLELRTLPATVGDPSEHWLLKMHGSLDDPTSIVLTRSDFVRYDARVKPAASVLQAVALTRHMLMVGLSLKDDNVVRLLLEVDDYRTSGRDGSSEPFATLLDVSGDEARAALWEGKVRWLRMGDGILPGSARELEVFLDGVAMHACQDTTWLLDERFVGLLPTKEDREIAREIRGLAQRVGQRSRRYEGWAALAHALEGFGASSEGDDGRPVGRGAPPDVG